MTQKCDAFHFIWGGEKNVIAVLLEEQLEIRTLVMNEHPRKIVGRYSKLLGY